MSVELLAMKGENDEELRWPIQAHFTLRLVNFKGGEDKVVTESDVVQKTLVDYQHVAHFKPSSSHLPHAFIEHSKIPSFIEDDQLLLLFINEPNCGCTYVVCLLVKNMLFLINCITIYPI